MYSARFHQHRQKSGGRQRRATTSERGVARNLSGHQQGRRAERENLWYKFIEMNQEVNVRHPGGSSMAKVLGKMRNAKDRDGTRDDQTYATKIDRGEEVQQELWRRWETTLALRRQEGAGRDLVVVCLLPLSQVSFFFDKTRGGSFT